VVSRQHVRRHYDLVQVSTMPDCLVFAGAVPKALGAFLLLDNLDPMPELYAAKYGVTLDALGARLLSIQEGASIRFADGVMTVLDEVRELLIKRHGYRQIDVILNCPDHTVLPRRLNLSQISEANDSASRPFVLLSHGSLVDRLGYDTIIDAVALLRSRIPNLVLRIVGPGEGRDALEARARDKGVTDRFQICLGVVLDRIPDMIDSADIGVVANKNDPFADLPLPTKLLEFAWMGKPVVSSRTTTISHYFDDSQVAFFEPGNAADLASRIDELYHDPQRRVSLAVNAGRFFDRYNWPEEARRYVGLVSDMMAKGRRLNPKIKSENFLKAHS